MQLRQLRYFVAVADHGSFSAAADALAVAQPSIGQQIRLLEDDLGTALFHRHSRGVELTETGTNFLARAKDILERCDEAERAIRDESSEPSGKVRVGLTLSASIPMAVPLVEACNRAFPKIRLVIVEALSHDLLARIADDRIDLAVTYSGALPDGVRGEPLADEDYHFCAAIDHPLAEQPFVDLGDVLDQRMCLPPETHILRRQVNEAAAKKGRTLDIATEVESIATTTMLVASGSHATILPFSAVAHLVAEGRLVAIAIRNPPLRRRMSLNFTARRHPTKAESCVRGLIASLTKGLIESGQLGWRSPRGTFPSADPVPAQFGSDAVSHPAEMP